MFSQFTDIKRKVSGVGLGLQAYVCNGPWQMGVESHRHLPLLSQQRQLRPAVCFDT